MENLNEACWEGYKAVGGKMKDGEMVPNCVPINEEDIIEDFCLIKFHLKQKHSISCPLWRSFG